MVNIIHCKDDVIRTMATDKNLDKMIEDGIFERVNNKLISKNTAEDTENLMNEFFDNQELKILDYNPHARKTLRPEDRMRKRVLKLIEPNQSASKMYIIRKISNTDSETLALLETVLKDLIKCGVFKMDMIKGKFGRPRKVYTRIV